VSWLFDTFGIGGSEEDRRKKKGREYTANVAKYKANLGNVGSINSSAAKLANASKPTVDAGKSKPGTVAQILGAMSFRSLSPYVGSSVHNAALLKKRTGSIFGDSSVSADKTMTNDLEAVGANNWWDSTMHTKKFRDVAGEHGYKFGNTEKAKQVKGEAYEGGFEVMNDLGVKNKALKFGGGLALEMGLDPATGIKKGFSSLAKANADDAIKVIADTGIDSAKMAELGIDVGKYVTPEMKAALDAGETIAHTDLPSTLAQEVAFRTLQQEGAKVAGKTVARAPLPFVRRAGGKLGLEAVVPTIRKIPADEMARLAKVPKPTIGMKLALKTGRAPGGKMLSTFDDAAKGTGEAVGALGTKVLKADKGGTTLYGKVLSEATPEAYIAKAGAAKWLRRSAIATKVEGAWNPVADVAKMGNPIATTNARIMQRSFIAGNSAVKHTAATAAKALQNVVEEENLHRMTLADDALLSPEVRQAAELLHRGETTTAKRIEAYKGTYGIDPTDAKAVRAKRLELSGTADELDFRIGVAQASESALKDDAQTLIDALPKNAGKSASTIRSRGAFKAGQAKGTGEAVKETGRSAAEAGAEYERMSDAVSGFGTRADEFGGGTGTAAKTTVREQMAAKVGTVDDASASVRAGIPDDATRTPIQLTPGGKPKRYTTWQSSVDDELRRINVDVANSNDVTIGTANPNAARGLYERDMNYSSRVDDLGTNNPDAVVDMLSGRVNSALDANDLDAAKVYAAHLEDYADWYSRPLASDDGWGDLVAGAPIPVDMPDVAGYLARAQAATPENVARVRGVVLTTRERLEAAYKSGRATGAKEAMRDAARGAIRAESRAASAEGRKANYIATIGTLNTDAERFEAAAEVLRRGEVEARNLAESRRMLEYRFAKAQAPVARFDAQTGKSALDVAAAPELEKVATDFTLSNIDYDAYEAELVKIGSTPEQARIAAEYKRDLTAQNNVLIELRKGSGTWDPDIGDKLAPHSGGAGYNKGTTPARPGIAETVVGTYAPNLGEAPTKPVGKIAEWLRRKATPQETLTRNRVIKDSIGVEASQFRMPFEDDAVQAASISGTAPKQVRAADFPTIRTRLEAGFPTETNQAHLLAQSIEENGFAVNKANLQKDMVNSTGAHVLSGKPREGFTGYSLTRDGVSTTYEVPIGYKKWIDKIDTVYANDESANLFFRSYDRVQNALKAQMTTLRAAFHGRNALTNYWMAWVDDSADPAAWEKAIQLRTLPADHLLTQAGETHTVNEWREIGRLNGVERGSAGAAEVRETTRREAARSSMTGETWMGVFPKHPFATARSVGNEVGTGIEDTSRYGVWFANLDKGMSHGAAARQVDRVLYDYSSEGLTAFERFGMKRLVPFYSWMRRNTPRMLEVAFTSPGKLTSMQKLRETAWDASGLDRTLQPQYLEDAFAMPVPTKVGYQMWSPGLPFQDLSLLGDTSKTQTSISPILTEGLQQRMNTDLFTGSPIERYPGSLDDANGIVQRIDSFAGGLSPWEALKKDLGMEYRTNRDGVQRVAMIPWQRHLLKSVVPLGESVGKAVDPIATPNDQMYFWTGLKTTPYSEAQTYEQYLSSRARDLSNRARVLQDQQSSW